MSIWSLTYQQSVSKLYQSDRHLSHIFLPTKWRQKSAGMDVEQNYVTVTLYIVRMRYYITVTVIWMVSSSQWTRCKMFRCSHVRTANTATWKRTKPRMEHDIFEEHLRHPEDRGNGIHSIRLFSPAGYCKQARRAMCSASFSCLFISLTIHVRPVIWKSTGPIFAKLFWLGRIIAANMAENSVSIHQRPLRWRTVF